MNISLRIVKLLSVCLGVTADLVIRIMMRRIPMHLLDVKRVGRWRVVPQSGHCFLASYW